VDAVATDILAGLRAGEVTPCLGPGVLADVVSTATGALMPIDKVSLILALNDGQPMASRLMQEFSRAAMNVELRRGRLFLDRFLTNTYAETPWTRAALHEQIARWQPPYVIDLNWDTQLQESYRHAPHTLVVGVARLVGHDYRFRLYSYDGSAYQRLEQVDAELSPPILFKPLGAPRPEPSFVASDADFMDYLAELMDGFAMPPFLKRYRQGKRYLLLGLRLTHDIERIILSQLVQGAANPAGWALLPDPHPLERLCCEQLGLEIVEATVNDLLNACASRESRR